MNTRMLKCFIKKTIFVDRFSFLKTVINVPIRIKHVKPLKIPTKNQNQHFFNKENLVYFNPPFVRSKVILNLN